ncbi:hypothetical protein ACFP3U_20035 [Kitasatospora misakiensis]|uniref:pPIWI-RE three-gene island domain-containing protein n=1 Tax=Kitasatospora misakiensis TaxID=67330 RepID=A0ABW0X7Y0_9ACTN
MRSTAKALHQVVRELRSSGSELPRRKLVDLCEIELGLFLQEQLTPGAPASEGWTLFSGYPFARERDDITDRQEHIRRTARYALWTWGRRLAWSEALKNYQQQDRQLRAFDVPDPDAPAARRPSLSVAEDRWASYERLLNQAPPFTGDPATFAGPGRYAFPIGRHLTTVLLPEHAAPTPLGHDLGRLPVHKGRPLTFKWTKLMITAAAMDARKPAGWVARLMAIRLSTRRRGDFRPARSFSVSGIEHLLGIVGAGKSTLRDVLAVHLARQGRNVTVVVGDVAEQLKLVELYNTHVPGSAAPVLGATGRQQHAERLHRRMAGRGEPNLLAHLDPGFQYLSTSCALNALRHADGHPADDLLGFGEAPCTKLQPPKRREKDFEDPWASYRTACPFWSQCPRHHRPRSLVDARIWVSTPPSLVDSRVPHPQNPERIRYLELACRRSDLMIVDEADRVQMQLDRMFAPAIPLLGGGPETRSFLDEVNQHRIRELASAGRVQLSDRDVENWSAAVNTTQAAADRLVAMLVRDFDLRKWVRTGYFSAGMLQLRLLEERFPLPEDRDGQAGPTVEHPHREPRKHLMELLDAFRDNPFGDRRPPEDDTLPLLGLLGELLHTNYRENTRARLRDVVCDLFGLAPLLGEEQENQDLYQELRALVNGDRDTSVERQEGVAKDTKGRRRGPLPQDSDDWLEALLDRFEFTMLLSALEPKLALINTMWPRVADSLSLGFNEMYRRPLDYAPMVPESPMGNVIGFQFLLEGRDEGGVRSGELRFFRCSGVGRELLRAMPGLPKVDGLPGTNVLLMSGSSWADKSSRYHVPVPIGTLIEPDPAELERIADQSEFRFEFVRETCACATRCTCDNPSEALRLSGAPIDRREDVLRRMATELGRNDHGQGRLLRELHRLPGPRRHILLLVGSYDEAALVADTLHTLNDRWRGRVRRLVSDDDPDATARPLDDEHHAPVLRRGDVETLAATEAEILVAPLLAVERGHNILALDSKEAAIGSVYFLARPNPRPDDLGLTVHAINDWIARLMDGTGFSDLVRGAPTLGLGARRFRDAARSKWFHVLSRSMAWSHLGEEDRVQVTWDMLVLIWQVIGRSVRGAVPTRVAFVDAAFAPRLAAADPTGPTDTPETSLLHSIHAVLAPYFRPGGSAPKAERRIVHALYRPLWTALDRCLTETMEGEGPACTH